MCCGGSAAPELFEIANASLTTDELTKVLGISS
jgi:hypothetical protein